MILCGNTNILKRKKPNRSWFEVSPQFHSPKTFINSTSTTLTSSSFVISLRVLLTASTTSALLRRQAIIPFHPSRSTKLVSKP